jgi:hypothetical protein
VYLALGGSGCMHVTREESLPALSSESVERGDESPVQALLEVDAGIARGHVEWAPTCERTVVEQARTRTVEETRPSKAAGSLAVVGAGLAAATALGFVVGQAMGDAFCQGLEGAYPIDDPEPVPQDCHHTNGGAIALGLTAVALGITGIALLSVPPSTTQGPVSVGPPAPPRVVAQDVTCETGPVAGLAVALYHDEERIAATTTDETGNFVLHVPAEPSRPLVLVVDKVLPNSKLLHQGDVLAHASP